MPDRPVTSGRSTSAPGDNGPRPSPGGGPDPGLREYRYRWSWDLPAAPEVLWPLVSDTERFNRDTGLPPIEDAREEGEALSEARRRLRLSFPGVAVEWEESPFEWVRPWRFGVVRRYRRGPLAEMRVLAELDALPTGRGAGHGGTRLAYSVVARTSGWLGRLAVPLGIGLLSRWRFGRVFRAYARRAARDGHPDAPPSSALERIGSDRRRLGGMAERLEREGGVPAATARRLTGHLASADELSLLRVRPHVLADLWGASRREVLQACLHATRLGYLDLHWDVLCPLCRGVKETAETLSELRARGVHCDTCLIDFSGDFTESVEISFRPTPALRPVPDRRFCVAGPQVTPHVVVQQLLAPGEEREVRPLVEPGRYRLRRHGTADGVVLRVREGEADPGRDGELDGGRDSEPDRDQDGDLDGDRDRRRPDVSYRLDEEGWSRTGPASGPEALPPLPTLRLANDCPEERLIVLERTAWSDAAVTAAEVVRLGTFRDLFSEEVLRVGDFADVGTVTLLFTDLKDSTRLYRREGDATAFGKVMDHFEVLEEAVEEAGGGVIKTIGDAIMAAFPSPEAGLRAALRAHRALREESRASSAPRLVLKAGLHTGPCIAVTLNGVLDYFGTTVNVASRLEGLSLGDDVVLSESVWTDPAVQDQLRSEGLDWEPSTTRIRGLEDERTTVWRLVVGRPPDEHALHSPENGPAEGDTS